MLSKELPAVLAAAEIALTTAVSARTLAPLWWTSLIYNQGTTHQGTAIAGLHSLVGNCVIIDFDEPKSSGFTAETISKDIHAVNVNTRFLKERLYIGFSSLVGKVPYEQLCHLNLLTVVRNAGHLGWLSTKEVSHQGES
jgi:hypothetical protein